MDFSLDSSEKLSLELDLTRGTGKQEGRAGGKAISSRQIRPKWHSKQGLVTTFFGWSRVTFKGVMRNMARKRTEDQDNGFGFLPWEKDAIEHFQCEFM